MNGRTIVKAVAGAVLGVALLLGGCVSVTEFLNEDFLADLGLQGQVASLPGDAPALLVAIENATSRWVEVIVAYRESGSSSKSYTAVVAPNARTAQMLVCPIEEITLGDLSNPRAIGAVVRLGSGSPTDAFIEVEPFGAVLRDGVNYDCGDGLTFVVQRSGATLSGYQTFAYIQRAGDGS